MKLTNIAISQLLAAIALADIVHEGLWTGNDWCNDDLNVCVEDGKAFSNDAETHRRITSPTPLKGDVSDYAEKDNVIRVKDIIDAEDWDYLFPMRNDVYTYEGFLNAVGKFPAFCGENNNSNYTDDEMCMKELATVFAHFVQETSYNSVWASNNQDMIDMFRQGLYYIEVIGCEGEESINISNCNWHDHGWANDEEAWPIQDGAQYYARGPFQLAWNYNYGRFSNTFFEDDYDSRKILLEDPDKVHEDPFTVFSAALWFYMTPQAPKPSMHDVATGYFQPNDADTAAGIKGGFGSTINIINGGAECGWYSLSAEKRVNWYNEFLDFFDITDTENLSCQSENNFPAGGAASQASYFTQSWTNADECQLVPWQTPFSIYNSEDYKRCVCERFGEGEADCPQAQVY